MAEGSEGEKLFDIDQVLGSFQKEYDSHKELPEDERLSNDIRTNLAKLVLKAQRWQRMGAGEQVDELVLQSFKKLKEIYNTEEELAKLEDIAMQVAGDLGKIGELIGKYGTILEEDET